MKPTQHRAALLVATVAVVAGPALTTGLSAGAAPCPEPGRVVERPDRWAELRPPPFDAGGSEITSYAVSAMMPTTAYVTNGTVVFGTFDGGCSWKVVYRTGQAGDGQLIPSLRRQIVSLAVPRRDPNRLYMSAVDDAAVAAVPRILVSRDRGTTFTESLLGLPLTGTPGRLALSLRSDTAYLTVDAPTGGAAAEILVTNDAGGRWTSKGTLPQPASALAIDPGRSDRLWGVFDGVLRRSDDGGATWNDVAGVTDPVSDVATGLAQANTQVIAAHLGGDVSHSDDAGETWQRHGTSIDGLSVAVGDELPLVAVAGRGRVELLQPGKGSPSEVSPYRSPVADLSLVVPLAGLSAPGAFHLYARSGQVLLRRVFTPSVPHQVTPPIDDLTPIVRELVPGGSLLPARTAVTLRPGETRLIDYTLTLPPVPTPLDVTFLMDTTGSMGGAINGLREGIGDIVRAVARTGTDAQFALVDFKDYPIAPWGGPGDFPYKLLRDLGPPDDELEDAIGRLQAGGGGDGPEANLPALYQAATGRGENVGGVEIIPSGNGVTFRPDSLRVFVMITDTNSHRGDPAYPGPSYDATVKALNAKQIRQVGIAVGTWARTDLEAIAKETDTFAPPGGSDCNNDGTAEVRAGQPLVCVGSGKGLAPAIIGLLRSIRDEAEVAVDRSGANVVTMLTQPLRVNVREPQKLRYRARIACRPDLYGQTVKSTLQGVSRGRILAEAFVTVTCAGPPVRPPFFDRPLPRPLAAAAAIPPPPPLAPVTNVQPNPNPNPNPQPHVQAQAGLAAQERSEVQLALAEVDVVDTEWTLEMSSHRQETDPALVWAAAGMLTAAAGAAARARTQSAAARCRVRR